jgi:glycosyltransferase involved in cell wall biosynthesis
MCSHMRISLVITTYNWPEALNVSLASVARQSRLPDDVIIADDGSGSATAELVQRWSTLLPCPVRHIWQEDRGFRVARARNGAVAASNSDYIVLIDGDMVLHPKFIADHADCARPDCFIQGARTQLAAGITARMLRSGKPAVNVLSAGIGRRLYAYRSVVLSRLTSKAKFSLGGTQGCNQSFWREHFLRVNGYDERFDNWGPEDREFSARLLHIGVQRYYVRHRAIAYHLHHKSRAVVGINPLDELLQETLRTRSVWSEYGVSSHRQ